MSEVIADVGIGDQQNVEPRKAEESLDLIETTVSHEEAVHLEDCMDCFLNSVLEERISLDMILDHPWFTAEYKFCRFSKLKRHLVYSGHLIFFPYC